MEILEYIVEGNFNAFEENLNFEVLEEIDEEGNTILHKAVRIASASYIQALLDAGADVNARNKIGETSAHIVARIDNEEIFQLLLEYGADLHIRNNSQRTPEDIAMMNKGRRVAKLLKNYNDEWGYTEKIQRHSRWED